MRRLLFVSAGLSLLLGLIVGLAILFRLPIAQAVLENRLAALGVSDAEVTVTALTLNQARLGGLILGQDEVLTADSLSLRYDLAQFRLSKPIGFLRQIVVERPILRVDLTGQHPPLGSLQALLNNDGEATAQTSFDFPPITLRQARIAAETPLGPTTVELHGSVTPEPDGHASARFSVVAEGEPGRMNANLKSDIAPGGNVQGRMIIEDGSFDLANRSLVPLSAADIAGAFQWRLENWQPASVVGNLTLNDVQHPGGVGEDATLAFDLTPQRARAKGKLRGADDGLEADFALDLDNYLAAPKVYLSLDGAAPLAALSPEALGLPPDSTGDARVRFHLWGTLAPFESLGAQTKGPELGPPGLRPLLAWLHGSHLGLRTELSLNNLTLPDLARGLSADIATNGSLKNGELRLALDRDSSLAVAEIAWPAIHELPAELGSLLDAGGKVVVRAQGDPATAMQLVVRDNGLSGQIAGAADVTVAGNAERLPLSLSGIGQVRLTPGLRVAGLRAEDVTLSASALELAGYAISDLKLTGQISGAPGDLKGRADLSGKLASAAIGDAQLAGAALRLPLTFVLNDKQFVASLQDAGQISLQRVTVKGVTAPRLSASIARGGVAFDLQSEDFGVRIEPEVLLKPDSFTMRIADQNGGTRQIDLDLGSITLANAEDADGSFRGHATLGRSRVTLDDPALTVEGLTVDARFDESLSTLSARFFANIHGSEEPPVFAPLSASGTAQRDGPTLRIKAEASPQNVPSGIEPPRIPFSVRYDLDQGRGDVALPETTVIFAPGGLQPSHLLPGAAALTNVAGTVTAKAQADLQGASATGGAELTLSDMTFRAGSFAVGDLDLSLVLDSLQPPRSEAGQRLTVARIDGILPMESIDATFQLLSATPPELDIEWLSFHLASGEFLLRDTLLAPGRPRQDLDFEVSGVELGQLFEVLSVEGLSGSGLLDGRLPLLVEGQEVGLKDGHLESRGPGVLSYRSDALQSSLPPDADDLTLLQSPVDLAIQALGNFHYGALSMDLDKAVDGDTQIALHIEGKNPELLDGYPFVFNINLKGNLNPLIAALRQGATLSDELINRTWRATP